MGIDFSPDFIRLARNTHPGKCFQRMDLQDLSLLYPMPKFDVAVLISIRPMVQSNLGDAVWQKMETELRKVANKLLFLEYSPDDPGSLE